ncbi:MAG: hypothetical protein ABI645_03480, partial [Pseudomonadota bacterium]
LLVDIKNDKQLSARVPHGRPQRSHGVQATMSYHASPVVVVAVLLLASACTQSGGTPCRPHGREPIGEPLEVWQRLRECIAAGDAKGALTFVDTKSQDFYGKMFSEVGDDLPLLQNNWPKTPQFVRNDGVIAQYAIILEGDEDSYLLDFIRRKDRGWYAVSF